MNMQALMAQAQKMQKDITAKKAEIDQKLFPGKSEWVEVEFKGNKELVSIKIKKDLKLDSDDYETLEDMIVIAINDSLTKIDRELEKQLGSYGSGLSGLI